MPSIERYLREMANISAPLIDRILRFLAANSPTQSYLNRKLHRRLDASRPRHKILIIPDVHIGDALITQSFIKPLRAALPGGEIHFIYQKSALPLIRNNPSINVHHPVFKSRDMPLAQDRKALKKLLQDIHFDLIVNFCPYFSLREIGGGSAAIPPIHFIANLIKAYSSSSEIPHVAYQMETFGNKIAGYLNPDKEIRAPMGRERPGGLFYASAKITSRTESIIRRLDIPPSARKIFYNPDASSRFTFIPIPIQSRLLKGILSSPFVDRLLMNFGRNFRGINRALLNELPENLKRKVIIIPEFTSFDIFAALVDSSELFISGDTGPLHVAGAQKIHGDSGSPFLNRTALLSIFGATSGRVYGYDSSTEGYMAAPQDAPSRVFEASPRCKNLACLNKAFKTCRDVRCFEGISPDEVIEYVLTLLREKSLIKDWREVSLPA
jgi:hypothetical protein